MNALANFFLAFRRWLEGGNRQGVTTRRLTALCVVTNQVLVGVLALAFGTDHAARMVDPLLVFNAAALGIYMVGRTVQAATAPASPTAATPTRPTAQPAPQPAPQPTPAHA